MHTHTNRPVNQFTTSATVNNTGRYVDLGGKGESYSLWDFAAMVGRFPDWQAAHAHFRQKAGVTGGKSEPVDVDKQLEWREWNRLSAGMWAINKPGITLESLEANGARLATHKWFGRSFPVIALPAYGPRLIAADPVNWVFWHTGNRELPRGKIEPGEPIKTIKMKTCFGGQSGLMGTHALKILAVGEPEPEIIWKVAGPSDMLALWSLIPPELRAKHLVLTNSNGELENVKPSWVPLFKDRHVRIIHDADQAGEVGAAGWLEALGPVAASVHQIRTPYPISEDHGKDLRDWITEKTIGY